MQKIVTNIKENKYLEEEQLTKIDNVDNKIVINSDCITTWLGMGGAITEASAYNYSLLSKAKKRELIDSYYSSNGLNYELGRVSIGSNDFSLKSFEYLTNDNLNNFNIDQDKKYVIPLLHDIYKEKKLDLIASPWSPPSFMKTNHNLLHGGRLKRKYYELYSDYLIKYLDEYHKLGFNIKYLTMQNEPFARQRWESCIYPLRKQKLFINDYLIDKLNDTQILLWDHNREHLNKVVNKLYINNKKIAGVGMHWYTGGYYEKIKEVHNKYPDYLIINTEMCCGYSKYNKLNWINDAELYLKDIISCMNNGVNAYLDWNILLDYNGGPSHKANYVKSAIILNEDKNDIIKTPIYYYLYHISHFIKRGYKIITCNSINDLYVVCACNKDDVILVVMNTTNDSKSYEVSNKDTLFSDVIKGHEIITYII